MEAYYAVELLPLLVSSALTHALPSSSASPSTQQATSSHLPFHGASDCQVHVFSSSNRKHSLSTASDHRTSSSSSSSSSASPTVRVTMKHSPRAFSDWQQQRTSSSSSASSSAQHVKRKRLRRALSDFQVQGLPSSPSIHVRRQHLPRAFSDFQPSSPPPSSTIQDVKSKHLPRAFVDCRSFLLSTQHSRRMYLPRAFSNYRRRFACMLAEQQQPPMLNVRTSASVGRLSGAVHGSNSRKGRHRKHYDIEHESNNQELETSLGKEIVGEPIPENTDSLMFCDDMPCDKDSDCYIYCENALCIEQNCTGSLHSSTYMYDSIHGDFWQTDPYYQEFENSQNEIARQGVFDGSTPYRGNDISIVSEKNNVEILDVGSSDNHEYLTAVQVGTGAAIVYESMDIAESRSVFPEPATEGSPSVFKETYTSVKEPSSRNLVKENTVQDFVGTLERVQQCSLDLEKSLSQKNERGQDMVREVGGGERPSASLGSLQNIEGTFLESRRCSGNSEVDGTDLECRSFAEPGNVGDLNTSCVGARANNAKITDESVYRVTEVTALADAHTLPVVEQVGQVVEQMADFLSDSIKEQVVNVVDQVEKLPAQVSQVAEQVMLKVVDQLPDPIVEQAGQVAEQVTQTAEQIAEQVASQVVEPISSTASQIVNFLSSDEDDIESDDEFEAYKSLDIAEFKGRQGLSNFTILQEEHGIISIVYDFYIFMLKRSLFEFMLGMFAAPILLSMIFTILYLPEFSGLALDETVREFLQNSETSANGRLPGLQLSWETVFQVFMFSVSLSTGLQPELAPLSPYTLVVANLNALIAQLIFVFLSGAVFARLSQPSQPVKCSTIAIICPPPSNRRLRKEACHKALLTRYVLAGPQPCELVDVKVDLTYNYNTVTRSGTYFRTSQSLKLVRPEIAFLNHGMLVRHIIDETSPLYQRTPGMLEKEDAVFSLSVVGLERSSMQSVFHVQHYCVYDKDVVWDAEFVDMILISKKNRRVVDHSLLSKWRTVVPR